MFACLSSPPIVVRAMPFPVQLSADAQLQWKTKEGRCQARCDASSMTSFAAGFWNMVFCGCAATIVISNAWSPLVGRSRASLRFAAPGHPAHWAQRLKRVFGIDIETCVQCGGPVRIVASIEDTIRIEKILTHRNEKTDFHLLLPESRAPPQVELFG